MSRLALAARLARREVRRRPGRTALVALLVALPVAAMVVALVIYRTDQRTPLDRWVQDNGQADATVYGAAVLPEGSTSVTVRSSALRAKTVDGQRSRVTVTDFPLMDPIGVGKYELIEGRAPREAGEVVPSIVIAERFGVGVGDELRLERPDATYRVVGIVEQVSNLDQELLVVANGSLLPAGFNGPPGGQLVDLPNDLGPGERNALAQVLGVELREEVTELGGYPANDFGDVDPVRWTYVFGAVVLTVLGIVIAAAFAAGARRQLVNLGVLSASGTAPSTLRATLVLQGTVTGVVGALAGLGLAAAVLSFGEVPIEEAINHRVDGWDVRPSELVIAALLGVVAATLAALVPAFTTARIPTLQAMAGRRPLSKVPRLLVVGGFVSVSIGLGLLGIAVLGSATEQGSQVWTLVGVAGGVFELLGACAVAPAVAARLEPLSARLRGSGRLAARSLARQRTRTGAVIAAVCAAGALAVASGALVQGITAQNEGRTSADVPEEVVVASVSLSEGSPRPPGRRISRQVRDVLPGAEVIPLRVAGAWTIETPLVGFYGPAGGDLRAIVAEDDVLDSLEIDAVQRRLLDDGGLVLQAQAEGITDAGTSAITARLADGRERRGRAVASEHGAPSVSSLLVSPALADELGLPRERAATVHRLPRALTDTQRGDLEDVQYDIDAGSGRYLDIASRNPSNGPSPFQVELLLAGLALVFSVLVVSATLALAAAESKDERDVLTVAGAPPRILGRAAGARAFFLSALGGVMAVPIGFLPVVVVSLAAEEGLPLRPPWATVGLLVVVVPLVAALLARLASGMAQHLRPVRVSTATFE